MHELPFQRVDEEANDQEALKIVPSSTSTTTAYDQGNKFRSMRYILAQQHFTQSFASQSHHTAPSY